MQRKYPQYIGSRARSRPRRPRARPTRIGGEWTRGSPAFFGQVFFHFDALHSARASRVTATRTKIAPHSARLSASYPKRERLDPLRTLRDDSLFLGNGAVVASPAFKRGAMGRASRESCKKERKTCESLGLRRGGVRGARALDPSLWCLLTPETPSFPGLRGRERERRLCSRSPL